MVIVYRSICAFYPPPPSPNKITKQNLHNLANYENIIDNILRFMPSANGNFWRTNVVSLLLKYGSMLVKRKNYRHRVIQTILNINHVIPCVLNTLRGVQCTDRASHFHTSIPSVQIGDVLSTITLQIRSHSGSHLIVLKLYRSMLCELVV